MIENNSDIQLFLEKSVMLKHYFVREKTRGNKIKYFFISIACLYAIYVLVKFNEFSFLWFSLSVVLAILIMNIVTKIGLSIKKKMVLKSIIASAQTMSNQYQLKVNATELILKSSKKEFHFSFKDIISISRINNLDIICLRSGKINYEWFAVIKNKELEDYGISRQTFFSRKINEFKIPFELLS